MDFFGRKIWGGNNKRRANSRLRLGQRGLDVEALESRQLLTVTLNPIVGYDANSSFLVPTGKDLFVPLTASDPGDTITYTVTSSNAGVTGSIMSGNPTLKLLIEGVDNNNQAFSGTLTIELFAGLAPETVETIRDLVESNFYDGLSFYRIIPDFMIQGGANGTDPVDEFDDELDPSLTFNSPGLMAMANPGTPDSNTSEFFITDIDQKLADMPQYLNFQHTIFGQLTSGFDIYQKVMNAKGITDSNSSPSTPVRIVSADIIDDTQNGVLQLSSPNNFVGTSTITVTAHSTDGTTATRSFTVNMATQSSATSKQPLILAPVQDLSTTPGTPISFDVTVNRAGGVTGNLTFNVRDPNSFDGAPSNVSVQVTATGANTARVTLTPAAGFKGTLELMATVDNASQNVADTQRFSLNVAEDVDVAITGVTDPINADNADSTSINGTGQPGNDITVVVSDGEHETQEYTTTVAANGTWSISNIDVSELDDGTLTYTVTAADDDGNEAEDSKEVEKDTEIPPLAITAFTERINNTNKEQVTISGTGESGTTITVTLSDGDDQTQEYTTTVGGDGKWSIDEIDASDLADGNVLFTVTAEDDAGNSIEKTKNGTKDVDAPDLNIVDVTDPITIANVTETSINGTGEVGAIITVVVTDGTRTTTSYTTTVAQNGSWRIDDIDVSSLSDGEITYRVKAKDEAGNETEKTIKADKSAVAITIVTDPVNADNEDDTSVSGTGQAGATVTLVVSDGTHTSQTYTTTIDENGEWSIDDIDVSMLDDGTITYTATAEDDDGNTAENSREVEKDTEAPEVEIGDATDPVNGENEDDATISGTGEAGSTITVVVTDGDNNSDEYTTTVNAQGNWTIDGIDLSDLDDGTITYRVTATDEAGNESEVVTLAAEKDTEAPDLDIEDVTDPINIGNSEEVTASGTGEPGATISIVVTDGTNTTTAVTTTVDSEGNWEIEGIDVSDLADGTITFRVTATDEAGNKTEKTQTSTKHTVHVTVVTSPVNEENEDNVTVSGTGQAGATVRVTITDGDNTTQVYTTTINSNGTWSISGIDVSDLDDGTLTVTAIAEDDDDNTATSTKTTTKDTDGPDVAISSVTDPINGSNDENVTASGTGEAGATITLTVTDGDNTTTTYTTTVNSNGTWTISGINVSSLDDGTLTFRVTAKDSGNNTTQVTKTATKSSVSNGSLSGVVYVDLNENGTRDANEPLLAGVVITLSGVDAAGNPLPSRTAVTASDGTYSFGDLAPGTYSLKQAQPAKLIGGGSAVGNLGGTTGTNTITGIQVDSGESGTNYNFREDGFDLSMISIRLFLASTPPGSELYSRVVSTWGVESPLVMSITKNDPDDTDATTVKYTVTFNEDVTGVNATDFAILGGTGASVASVTGSGKTYTVTVNVGTGGGPISLKLADNDSIKSAKGNALGGTGNGNGDFIGPAYSLGDETGETDVTFGSVTDPINAENEDEVTASGTGNAGDKITLVVSKGDDETEEYTTTVGANGVWTIDDIDVSDLDDGTLTFTVTAEDGDGNKKTVTKTAIKDTVAPEVEADEVTDPINGENEDEVTISGTGEVGAKITVVATDGDNETQEYTTTVGANGTWSIAGINVSMLDDGTITFNVTAEDAAGNTSEDEIEAEKDTEDPEVELEEVTDPLTIANHKAAEASGTGEPGATITLTVTDGTKTTQQYTAEVDDEGNWSIDDIDTSELADGTLTYTVTARDAAGNTATDTRTAVKKTVAVGSVTDPINIENQDDVTISGTGEPGATITVVATDGDNETQEYTTTIAANGTWTIEGIDVSELDDGEITFNVKATDENDNFAETSKIANKDTVAPEGEVTDVTDPINIENQDEVTASGTGEEGAIVTLTVTDGENTTQSYTATIGSNGQWTINGIDVSELADGELTFNVTIKDAAGNETESSIEANKDTETPDIVIDTLADPVTIATHKSITLSGTGEPGSTISVVVTDGTHSTTAYTATVAEDGSWTIEDIDTSTLADGEITFEVTAEDAAGNTATASVSVTKRTVAINPIGLIGPDDVENLTVSGTGEPNATITLVVSDGTNPVQTYTATVGEDGTWSITGIDVSELDEGNLTFTATAEDAEENTAETSAIGVKDTTGPQIVVNAFTNTINSNTDNSVTASGTGEVGATVKLKVTDGTNTTQEYTTEVGEDGTWTIEGIDVSELADGELTFEVTASDEAGNETETSKTANKDATPPDLAISHPDETVGIGEEEDTTASGTGEEGATVKVVVSDGTNSTEEYETTIDEEGNWSIDGIDVSDLLDGTITYTATATDAAGNSKVATKTATKRTVAITSITDPIDEEDETEVEVSGTGQAGATIKLVVSDGTDESEEYTTTVGEDGTWSIDNIDVSDLDDGNLTFTATATAGANTAEATKIALKDTDETELTVEEFTETINDENKGEVTISGTGEEGAAVRVVVTDGEHSTVVYTAEVDDEGNWTIDEIDVSDLDDGELTFNVTIEDGDGNEAYASETATKDTEIAGEVTGITAAIDAENEDDVTASGTGEVGAIVTLVVSDGEDETTSYTATVGEDGTWAIEGIDVSELADGTLTFTVTVEDEAGNSIEDTITATKDTSEVEAEPASIVDQAFAEEDYWL